MAIIKKSLQTLLNKIIFWISSDLGKRVGGAAFWSIVGAVSQKIMVLLTSFVCMRVLGEDGFGEIGIVRSTIQTFIIFGSVGMGSTAAKYISEYRGNQKDRLESIYTTVNLIGLIFGAIALACVLFFADGIAAYLKHPDLSVSIRIGGLLLYFSIINSFQSGILSGMEKFGAIAIIAAVGGLLEFVFISLGAVYYGVHGALWGYGIGFVFITLLNQVVIHRELKACQIRFDLKTISRNDFKILILFSIPLMGSGLIVSPVTWFSQGMLVRFCGLAEQGLFAMADQWRMIVLFVPSAMSRIILPILSNLNASNDLKSYIKVLKINLLLNGMVAFLAFASVSAISPWVVKWYDVSSNSVWLLVIVCASAVFASLATVAGQAIVSRAKIWIGLLFNVAWGAQVLLYEWIFIKAGMAATALAWALLLAYFMHASAMTLYLCHLVKRMSRN